MRNRMFFVSLAVVLAISMGLIGCGSEEVPEITQYNITISSTEGGSVTTPGEATFTYDEGEVVELVADADEGYQFVGWTGDVGTIANVNAATTTITMNGDYSITANFGRSYHLAISSSEGGNVTNPGEGIFTYGQGFIVTLRTLAGDGYRFVNWTGDVSTIANVNGASTTITMNGDYSVSANFKEDEVVTFIDHNLEAAVRAAIAKPESPIYTADMERLGSFSAQATGISSLTGLEYAANLMSLYLQYNQISDISPLANLTNLTQLHLEGNRISDISPLANLTNLKSLNLQYNPISDISPLVNNPGLSQGDEVYLSNNPLSSTSMNTYIPQLQGRGVVVYWP